MQTDKAGKLIRKIQALYENLNDQGKMSALERDLILSYLRELYEEIAMSASAGSSMRQDSGNPKPATAIPEVPKRDTRVFEAPTPIPEPVIRPAVQYKEPEPAREDPALVPVVREAPVKETEKSMPDPVQSMHEMVQPPAHTPVHPSGNGNGSETHDELLGLFEFKQIGELSEKLQLQPLDRLEQGMGINERILMINELFRGDGILFNQTLKDLDSMRSFEEARKYLISGVAQQFQWGDKSRRQQAAIFVQLVRRRFLLV